MMWDGSRYRESSVAAAISPDHVEVLYSLCRNKLSPSDWRQEEERYCHCFNILTIARLKIGLVGNSSILIVLGWVLVEC